MSRSHLKSFLLISFKAKFRDYLLHPGCFSLLKPLEQDEIMFKQLLLTNSWPLQHLGVQTERFYARWLQTRGQLGDLVSPFPTLDCCWCDAQCAAQSNIPPCPAAKEKIWESSNRWECISEINRSAREINEPHWRRYQDSKTPRQILEGKGHLNMTCFNELFCSPGLSCLKSNWQWGFICLQPFSL